MQDGSGDQGEKKQGPAAEIKDSRILYNIEKFDGQDIEDPSNFPRSQGPLIHQNRPREL